MSKLDRLIQARKHRTPRKLQRVCLCEHLVSEHNVMERQGNTQCKTCTCMKYEYDDTFKNNGVKA